MDDPYHRANQHRWDAAAPAWGRMHDQRGDWRSCADDPTLVFVPAEMKHLEGLQDQAVAVLGSGMTRIYSIPRPATSNLPTSPDAQPA